jgi:hypothetical protein
VTHDYLISLPVLIPAVFLGRMINQRIPAVSFSRFLYSGLAVIGIALLAQSL